MKRKLTSYLMSQSTKEPSDERKDSVVEREKQNDSDEMESESSPVALHGGEFTDSDSDSGLHPWECAQHSGRQRDEAPHLGHSSAVGLSVKCSDASGPPDISRSRAEGPAQPQLTVFPQTAMGDRQRNFKASWYSRHTWIEYSQCRDAVYCYACRHFGLPNTESVFTSDKGYKNWIKDGGFASHAKSEVHINAMLAWKKFEKEGKNNALSHENKKQLQENCEYLYIKSVAEVLLLTATQNIAQGGHGETVDSNNKGNFLAILELLGNHNTVVKKKLKGAHNAKYTSSQLQNEILDTLAEMVRSTIVSEVKESQVFTLIADETKDMKKEEQISLVLRYYYRGAVKESLLHFEAAEHLNAAGLADKIIHILEKYGLEYRHNLVGQAYDGASVMSGKNSGVHARVQGVAKQAFYVHCNAHCLNLVLVDTVKTVPEVECFFSLVQRLYTFMSESYVQTKWLNKQKDMYDGAPRELQRLSDTRWACHYESCETILDRLPAIICSLEDIIEELRGDRSVDAKGLLAQMDLQFVGLLVTLTRLFGLARCLSGALQSSNLDLALAVELVQLLVQTLTDFRDETYFEELWREVIRTAEQCNIETEPAPETACPVGHAGMGQLGGYPEQIKDNFRTGLFYPVLDHMLTEINTRFSKLNCEVMRGIQALNPTNATFCNEAALIPFASIYGGNIDDLRHELHQLKRFLERKSQAGLETPSGIVNLTKLIEPHREAFHEVFRLCKIAVVIPVSTAACEKSSSVLNLIKGYLTSTMADERLSNLGVLCVESKRAKGLDLDDFVNQFALRQL